MPFDDDLTQIPDVVLEWIVNNMRVLDRSWTELSNEKTRRDNAQKPAVKPWRGRPVHVIGGD